LTLIVIGGGGYASDGAAIVGAGQAPVLLVELTQPAPPGPDVPQVLTGRTFVQRVLTAGGAVALSVGGVIQVAAGQLLFSLPVAGLAALLPGGVASVALTHTVVEIVTGGEVQLLSRPFTLVAATVGPGQLYDGVVSPNQDYLIDTSTSQTVTLPLISVAGIGAKIRFKDIRNKAGIHPWTYDASGSDKILDHDQVLTSWPQNISNTVAEFTATALGWRVIVDGG
jgi:hypothetical protein